MRHSPKFATSAESISAETGSPLLVNEGLDEDFESRGTRQRYLEGPVVFPGCWAPRFFQFGRSLPICIWSFLDSELGAPH